MIKLENVSFKYNKTDEKNILENINLEINEGEIISIIGQNGSGKSTFAKLISGLIKPSKGKVSIDELDISNKKNFLEIRKKVGIVFQNPENQIIFNNVYDDICFTINNLKLKNENERIKKALEEVEMLEYINSNTYELSLRAKTKNSHSKHIKSKTKIFNI